MSEPVEETRTYDALLNGLEQYVREEIEGLEKLVTDMDTFCPARTQRAGKLQAFREMDGVLGTLRDWEWA